MMMMKVILSFSKSYLPCKCGEFHSALMAVVTLGPFGSLKKRTEKLLVLAGKQISRTTCTDRHRNKFFQIKLFKKPT